MRRALDSICLALLVLAAGPAQSADTASKYLCVPDKATGFRFDFVTKEWEQASFVADAKWRVEPAPDARHPAAVAIFRVEPNLRTYQCDGGFTAGLGVLECSASGLGEFNFNRKNLRYIRSSMGGYYDGGDNNSNTPLIEIGRCSPL